MARERSYDQIGPVLFTQDGQSDGTVTISNTYGFKVKMKVTLNATGFDPKVYIINRILSETQLVLGLEGKGIHSRADISAYTLALNSSIVAPEQERPNIPPVDYERAVYEEEPVVAKRVINVDEFGNAYNKQNGFPVVIEGIDELNITVSGADSHGIAKILILNKGVPVPFVFPNNLKYYKIKTRDSKDVIKIGLSPTEIIEGKYWTLGFGNIYDSSQFVDFSDGYTLYFESKFYDNVELEVLYYTKNNT